MNTAYIYQNPLELREDLFLYIKNYKKEHRLIIVIPASLPFAQVEEILKTGLGVDDFAKIKLISSKNLIEYILKTYYELDLYDPKLKAKSFDQLLFYEKIDNINKNLKPQILSLIQELRTSSIDFERLRDDYKKELKDFLPYYNDYLNLLKTYKIQDENYFLESLIALFQEKTPSIKHSYLFYGFSKFNSTEIRIIEELKHLYSIDLFLEDIQETEYFKLLKTSLLDFMGFEIKKISTKTKEDLEYILSLEDAVNYIKNKDNINSIITNVDSNTLKAMLKSKNIESSVSTDIQLSKTKVFNLILSFLDEKLHYQKIYKLIDFFLDLPQKHQLLEEINRLEGFLFTDLNDWIKEFSDNTIISDFLASLKLIPEQEEFASYQALVESLLENIPYTSFYIEEQKKAILHLLRRLKRAYKTINSKKQITRKDFKEKLETYGQEIYLPDREHTSNGIKIYNTDAISIIDKNSIFLYLEEAKTVPPERPFINNSLILKLRNEGSNILRTVENLEIEKTRVKNILSNLKTLIIPIRSEDKNFYKTKKQIDIKNYTKHNLDFPEFVYKNDLSFTSINRYKMCPYLFFLEKILKIESTENTEILSFEPLNRGSFYHDVLKNLDIKYFNTETSYDELYKEVLLKLNLEIDKKIKEKEIANNIFLDLDKKLMSRRLSYFLIWFQGYLSTFNIDFDAVKREEKFEFEYPNLKNIIKGSIDIILNTRDNKFFLYDYKTGSIKKDPTQLAFYTLGLIESLKNKGIEKIELSSSFISIENILEKDKHKEIFKDLEGKQLHINELKEYIFKLLESEDNKFIDMQEFIENFSKHNYVPNYTKKECENCDFKGVCSGYKAN